MNYEKQLNKLIEIINENSTDNYEIDYQTDNKVPKTYRVVIMDQNQTILIESYSKKKSWNYICKAMVNRMITLLFEHLKKN